MVSCTTALSHKVITCTAEIFHVNLLHVKKVSSTSLELRSFGGHKVPSTSPPQCDFNSNWPDVISGGGHFHLHCTKIHQGVYGLTKNPVRPEETDPNAKAVLDQLNLSRARSQVKSGDWTPVVTGHTCGLSGYFLSESHMPKNGMQIGCN